MSENEYQSGKTDPNECSARGACSISPDIAALQETAFYFIKQNAHYLVKLEKLGADNKLIKKEIIKDISSLVYINELSESQIFSIIKNEYLLLKNTRLIYENLCGQNKITCVYLKEETGFTKDSSVSTAISAGENLLFEKYNEYSQTQRNLSEIMELVIKSLAFHLVNPEYSEDIDNCTYSSIFKALDLFNHSTINESTVKSEIENLANLDNRVIFKISNSILEKYGEIRKTSVSRSTRAGKAILVSGSNFIELENILNQTLDKNIDVYTHSDLIIAHILKRFMQYPNLKGHYGDKTENNILDFATFPGAIFLTKNAKKNTEYLYRGRLFSSGHIIPKGVIKVENNDYSKIIETALNVKGFKTGKKKTDTILGYDKNELNNIFNKVSRNIKSGEIKRLYIIGTNAYSEIQKAYFESFLSKLEADEYAITFCDTKNTANIYSINLGNYLPLENFVLYKLFEKIPIDANNIYFFFTNCDVMTISNIITLEKHNAKNIYMANCPPTFINPPVFYSFQKFYNIKLTTNPTKDIEGIRNIQK